MKQSRYPLLLIMFLILYGFSQSAFAYIDPGTGSIFLQLMLGGIAGAVVVLKLYWHRLIGIFRRDSQTESEDLSSEEEK